MYDFKSLSDVDFEFLTRDLLQKELAVTLESFTSGRDDGTDLRYSCAPGDALVVQCKHFANSKYANLKSVLKTTELSKIKKLALGRYILATSLGLTPANKKELFDLLAPYCRSEADIFGREDLNNLLTKFPEVERTHFKLWLTGTAVLQRIQHSAIFNQTEFEAAAIAKKLKLYVQNASYREALEILESDHYCIVAGIPGIGKTTLAEVLLVHYLNLGYEAFAVGGDIKDAYDVYHSGRQQIFFYDDFLGQTSFEEKLHKNEEQKLLRFIETVGGAKNTRFVLTTREYILNQAKFAYEKLDRSRFDVNKCVVSLDKYTAYDKARILYNHLYFSDLPDEYKQILVKNQNYLKIIEHENYSPRVIKWMTEKGKELEINAADYFEHFVANLDNPIRLWEHAYENQLSNPAQHLMLVLGTLPNEVLLDDLEVAFQAYYQFSAHKRNFQTGKNDFRRALKESESNFIYSERRSGKITVRFHNPSVRDFVEHRLGNDAPTLRELCAYAVFYEQVVKLWNLAGRKSKENDGGFIAVKSPFETEPDEFLERLQKTIGEKGCALKTFASANNRTFVQKTFPAENRLLFANLIAEKIFGANSDGAFNFLEPFYAMLRDRLNKGQGEKEDLLSLLAAVQAKPLGERLLDDEFLTVAKEFFSTNFFSTEDFKYFLNFKQDFEDLIEPKEWESVKEEFADFTADEIKSFLADYKPDPGVAEWWIYELTELSNQFEVEIDDEIQSLKKFIDAAALEEDESDKAGKAVEPVDEQVAFTDKDIADIFDTLLDK